MKTNYSKALVKKFDGFLSRGLCSGVGDRNGQMCIEAAVCATLGLPHGDDPECVSKAVRAFKIKLNDCNWSSPKARAKGLRDLGLAQIGSESVVNDVEFSKRLSEKVIRKLVPDLFRRFKNDEMQKAADLCEKDGNESAARSAWAAARSAKPAEWSTEWLAEWSAEWSAASAASAARSAWSAKAAARSAESAAKSAESVAWLAASADDPDYFLKLMAKLALKVLVELKSPGVQLLNK